MWVHVVVSVPHNVLFLDAADNAQNPTSERVCTMQINRPPEKWVFSPKKKNTRKMKKIKFFMNLSFQIPNENN